MDGGTKLVWTVTLIAAILGTFYTIYLIVTHFINKGVEAAQSIAEAGGKGIAEGNAGGIKGGSKMKLLKAGSKL